jgi:protein-S-isoprenylcysteine O-methyltransferase Ste14
MNELKKNLTLRAVLQMVLFIIIVPLLPLLISWQWKWREAWVYAAVGILGFAVSRALAARRHPDLIVERSRLGQVENVKAWDRLLSPLVGLGSGLIPLAAGLEARLGLLAEFSTWVKILALILLLGGYALGTYALMENRYFSGMVRIQKERDHQVISSGPYAWMRHPGYAGALLAYIATPLWLDSPWAFLPAGLIGIILIIRTVMEDRTLMSELDGYREYSRHVRYRLLPGVW